MLVKEIKQGIEFANPAVARVFGSGDDWLGTVMLPRTVIDFTEVGEPELDLKSHDYPVQIRGDFSLLASLLLAPAHSAFAVGDNQDGCGQIWAAAESALSIVAESRGRPCQTEDDHFDLLESLQAETGKYEDPDIVAGYSLACTYRDGAEYGFLEDYVIKGGLPYVRIFITELLSYVQESA